METRLVYDGVDRVRWDVKFENYFELPGRNMGRSLLVLWNDELEISITSQVIALLIV